MLVKIRDGKAVDVKLRIYEPPLLRGAPARPLFHRGARHHRPDLRDPPGRVPDFERERDGGRLRGRCRPAVARRCAGCLICGEWIESHALHVFMLRRRTSWLRERDRSRRGRPRRAGRARAAHEEDRQRSDARLRRRPRGAPDQRPGGRLRPGAPTKRELAPLIDELERARDFAGDCSLHRRARLPRCSSRTTSSSAFSEPDAATEDGLLFFRTAALTFRFPRVRAALRRGARRVVECTALAHARRGQLSGRPAGALGALRRPPGRPCPPARRPRRAGSAATSATRSARSSYAPWSCLRRRGGAPADRRVRVPDPPFVEVVPRAGVGYGCSEAPRGHLLAPRRARRRGHDPRREDHSADLAEPSHDRVPDWRGVVERYVDLPDDQLFFRREQSIRNYDPCISCATHFLAGRWTARDRDRPRQRVWRGDDGVGLEVARRVRGRVLEGEPLALVDVVDGEDDVVLMLLFDAAPGTIFRFEAR